MGGNYGGKKGTKKTIWEKNLHSEGHIPANGTPKRRIINHRKQKKEPGGGTKMKSRRVGQRWNGPGGEGDERGRGDTERRIAQERTTE